MWYAMYQNEEGWHELARNRNPEVLRYFYHYAEIVGGW
jgi:hypothetical protein